MSPFVVRNGYANSVWNGRQLVTVAVAAGFWVEPPAARAVLWTYVVVRRACAQSVSVPWVKERPNVAPVAVPMMYAALVSALTPAEV